MARLISASEVTTLPRGRKPVLNEKVLAALKPLVQKPTGILLVDEFGAVEQEDRQKVSAEIRKHWKHLSNGASKVRIRYSTEGYPQVLGPKA